MFGGSKKPYTAVTVQVDRLTSENYEENEVSGIPDLIESIRLQDSGPSEASRAIRKKLKYGNVHRQLRALTILDALIANAGKSFQRTFADEPLLERLRIAATDSMSVHEVRAKCKILFAQWAINYKNTQGLQSIASLYQQLPQRRRPQPKPRDPSPDENDSPTSPTTRGNHSTTSGSSRTNIGNSNARRAGVFGVTTTIEATGPASTSPAFRYTKSRKTPRSTPFNLEKEKPQLIQSLASVSIATTNLTNSLKLINREKERPSENAEVMNKFEACKELRRTVLRYIQHVESEQFLGSLIHANEELVGALSLFMRLDKPIEEDSDSEDEWNGPIDRSVTEGMGEMSFGGKGKGQGFWHGEHGEHGQREEEEEGAEEDDDPDNPFGDANEVEDFDKEGVTWKVI